LILLTCAIDKELSSWKPREGIDVLTVGVGPVEAACAVTQALTRRAYRLVVNAGLGGAIGGAAEIGDGVAVNDETMELELEDGQPIVLPDGNRVVHKAYSDRGLVAALVKRGYRALHGITVSRVTSTEETASRLARLGAQVESMEGFAVLRAAQRVGISAIELRGISNRVGSRDRSGWSFNAGTRGLESVLAALFEILDATGAPPTP
jgi:futalosine hydrolase